MPSLHLTIHRIRDLAIEELVRQAQKLERDDALHVLNFTDVTADYVSRGVALQLVYLGHKLFNRILPLTIFHLENRFGRPDVEKLVTETMSAHMNLLTQMHFARLAQMFPKSILTVEIEGEQLVVEFKNGHKAIGPLHEAKTELFHARCAMLYDLPEL